jgi:hypothetical protein
MGNKAWDDTSSGSPEYSNARTTGRVSGDNGAEAMARGVQSKIAHPGGGDNDPMDGPGDVAPGAPGQLSTC